MDIQIENIGYIKSGKITTNDITIIFGPNNVGKTYLSYSIYSVLSEYNKAFVNVAKFKSEMADEVLSKGEYSDDYDSFIDMPNEKKICEILSDNLPRFFKDSSGMFKDSKLSVGDLSISSNIKKLNIDVRYIISDTWSLCLMKKKNTSNFIIKLKESAIVDSLSSQEKKPKSKDIVNYAKLLIGYIARKHIFDFAYTTPFIITSERTGISLFLKEIDKSRSDVINIISERVIDSEIDHGDFNSILKNRVTGFSAPINHNINVIRESNAISGRTVGREDRKTYNKILETIGKLIMGKYNVSDNDIVYSLMKENGDSFDIPISLASSSGKSLFLFDLFVKKYLDKNSYLIIDEPELNLHPKSQLVMAELLVRMANYGVKIIMTTHSDFLLKEINNRIIANSVSDEEVLRLVGYNDVDVISKDRVSAFTITRDGIINEIKKDKYGVSSELFDEAIIDVDKRMESLLEHVDLEFTND